MSHSQNGPKWFCKNLIEILPAAVYVCDAEAVIVAFNTRATELWGRTPELGQTHERFCGSHKLFRTDGTFLPHHETPMECVLRTGEAASDQEAVIQRPDGSRVSVLVNIAPLFDDGGKQIGAISCFQDLSAQKDAEKECERLHDALRQSQKMEAIGQLTSGLAHDFNNLLADISGNLELLRKRIEQSKAGNLGRHIIAAQDALGRAATLTHRLLAFSRQQPLDPRPTDINRVIVGLTDLVRRTVGPGIAVKVIAGEGLWNTRIDPNQLENALLNLCINARDAMPFGGKLTLETDNMPLDDRTAVDQAVPPGDYVVLRVSDTGCGMTPSVLARAFDPFFTTKLLGAGTGLGLSMVHGFARQSGGQASIYSEPGRGTKVNLYLPRAVGVNEILHVATASAEATRAAQGTTVLVVDDEPTLRILLAEMLEDAGYIVIEAGDAVAALRVLLSNVRIDLLVTDVGLPGGMDGQQLAEAARNCRQGLPVLFITGYAADVVPGNNLELGTCVMTKPFALDLLGSEISKLLPTGRPSVRRRQEVSEQSA
jgi:PAS domain S-box-containing protein